MIQQSKPALLQTRGIDRIRGAFALERSSQTFEVDYSALLQSAPNYIILTLKAKTLLSTITRDTHIDNHFEMRFAENRW